MQIFNQNKKVLFEGDLPLKELLKKAFKMRADLEGAVLDGGDLSGLDFSEQTLTGVSFKGANLKEAVFQSSYFYQCDFTNASFENTNLLYKVKFYDCVFKDVKMYNCIGEGAVFKNINLGDFLITFNDTHLSIGCRQFTIDEWEKIKTNSDVFTDNNVNYFERFMYYKEGIFELVALAQTEFYTEWG